MKTIRFFLFIAVTCVLTACGSSMSPKSEKIQGDLGDYFEVVSKDYTAKDGKVAIEFKRIKEGFPEPWRQDLEVGTKENTFMPIFTIEYQDDDSKMLSKEKCSISDVEELNALAALEVDETSSITFDCPEEAIKFNVSSTFEYNVIVNMEGEIGKYPIAMTMHIVSDGNVTGAYYYKRKGPGNYLYIKGEKIGDKITLKEFTIDGQQTGSYTGTFENGTYSSNFDTSSGYYAFNLKPVNNMKAIDLNGIDFDSFIVENISDSDSSWDDSNVGSGDWDDFLDAYERYVDTYISCVKKAANGDISALAEYAELLAKAQEYGEKFEGAQSNMSSAQWSRYLKITSKMSKAMQDMQ